MADLLWRGRGSGANAHVPVWSIRLAGAAVAIGIFALADALGVWSAVGAPPWIIRLLALAAGAVLAPTMVGSALWLLLGTLTCLTFLVSYTPIVRPLIAEFIRADTIALSSPPDVVVVLSGDLTDRGLITGMALDRLLSGAMLATQRGIPSIALSVTALEDGEFRADSERDQRALVAMLAPLAALHFVRDVHSTRDEAVAFAALARAQGWRRVMLVTSPSHSRRACMSLERVGLSVECRPADARTHDPGGLAGSEIRRLVFQDVLYESAATLLYRVRGWM